MENAKDIWNHLFSTIKENYTLQAKVYTIVYAAKVIFRFIQYKYLIC